MGQTLVTAFSSSPPETFSVDELNFLDDIPDHLHLECPICLQVMTNDPYIISCCGNHFCGACINSSKRTNPQCPLCKASNFEVMIDKGLQRTINGLRVKCIYNDSSCDWIGQLQGLSDHMSRDKRQGECLYPVVKCGNGCGHKDTRWKLTDHEGNHCIRRTVSCTYCLATGEHRDITTSHLGVCPLYPIPCPNNCRPGLKLPRKQMKKHLSEKCPLVDVQCDYKWAGCKWIGFRGDHEIHAERSESEHLLLVSMATKTLTEENEDLKKEMKEMKTVVAKMAREVSRQGKEIEELKKNMIVLQNKPIRLK
ncbi:PREDICTED: TNF receptor-associated factor 4-like [Amphimedon queenslandica]|uniref:RING-type domain-containing protein n=1 Tax=Amphimedon queenslandica TaxID=400682 RepID=A0A1X7VI33_AMPQE|nr:PREDICTED: TNF receptor-associated factor 4-like [Amphimedon queenslandica]|eukprot:XP_011410253.1 PREDICTED: TNF receptor-associated factor 4-like [Amphimedon queenslandica]